MKQLANESFNFEDNKSKGILPKVRMNKVPNNVLCIQSTSKNKRSAVSNWARYLAENVQN